MDSFEASLKPWFSDLFEVFYCLIYRFGRDGSYIFCWGGFLSIGFSSLLDAVTIHYSVSLFSCLYLYLLYLIRTYSLFLFPFPLFLSDFNIVNDKSCSSSSLLTTFSSLLMPSSMFLHCLFSMFSLCLRYASSSSSSSSLHLTYSPSFLRYPFLEGCVLSLLYDLPSLSL